MTPGSECGSIGKELLLVDPVRVIKYWLINEASNWTAKQHWAEFRAFGRDLHQDWANDTFKKHNRPKFNNGDFHSMFSVLCTIPNLRYMCVLKAKA